PPRPTLFPYTTLFRSGRADLRLLRRGPLYWYAGFVLLALFSAVLAPNPLLTVFRSAQLAIALLLVISLRDHLKHIYLFICLFLRSEEHTSELQSRGHL